MRKSILFSLTGAILLALTTVSNAEPKNGQQRVEEALQWVPKNAYGFGVLNNPHRLREKLGELARQTQFSMMSSMLKEMDQKVSRIKGINTKGSVLAVLLAGKKSKGGQTPAMVLMVPVSNFKTFLDNFDKVKKEGQTYQVKSSRQDFDATIVRHKDYVLMTQPENKSSLMAIVKEKRGIADSLQVEPQWLSQQDAALVVTERGVDSYIDFALMMMEDAALKENATFFHKLLTKVRKDIAGVAYAIQLDKKENLTYVEKTFFHENSSFAKGLKDAVAPKNLFADVPQRDYAIAAAMSLPKEVEREIFDIVHLAFRSYTSTLNDGQVKSRVNKMIDSTRDLSNLKVSRFVLLAHEGRKTADIGICGLLEVENATKVMKQTAAGLDKFGKLAQGLEEDDSELMKISKKQMTLDGKPAIQLITSYKSKQKKRWQAHSILSVVSKNIVAFGCSDNEKAAKLLIDDYRNVKRGFGQRGKLKRVMQMFPENPHFVFFVNPRQAFRLVRDLENEKSNKMKQFPKTSPIGFAVKFSPNAIVETVVVPGDVFRATSRFRSQTDKGSARKN